MTDPFAADRFLVEQLVRPIVNLYRVSALGAGDEPAAAVAFVRQKRMAIKEDIRIFADESETRELFRIKARRVLELGGRYDVTTPDGARIGVLEKVFGRSLLRSTWRVLDAAEQPVATAQERNMVLAIVRRVIDELPIPYHFDVAVDGQRVGGLTRKFQLRDRYVLDLTGDPDRRIDRRVAVALAIGLDTLQNR